MGTSGVAVRRSKVESGSAAVHSHTCLPRAFERSDFAWHQAKSAALANTPDDVLEEMYRRQEEFKQLQDERESSIWRYLLKRQEINASNETENWKVMSRAQAAGEAGAEMRALDGRIQDALIQAKVDGCLEYPNATKCDWSPHYFADVLQQSLLEQKQAAYKACMRLTKNDFKTGAHILTARSNGVPGISCEDCTTSTTKVDEYLTKFDAQLRAYEPIKYDPKTKKPILGATTGEFSKEGSDDFGVETSWTAGFSGKDFLDGPASYCKANVRSYGTFETKVKILGTEVPIIASNLDLATTPHPSANLRAAATLRVLGQDLITPINRASPAFNLVAGPNRSAKQGGSTYIVVIAVPLKLEARFSPAPRHATIPTST